MNDERQWGIPPDHHVHEDVVLSQTELPEMWDMIAYKIKQIHELGITGRGVKMAVNDTGVDWNHPLIPTPIAKRSFVDNDPMDVNRHGTWCAGRMLGRGGVGICPDADLIVAKVLDNRGSGPTTAINAGRVWVAEQGADLINESLGGPGGSQSDVQSIEKAYEAGLILDVAAAGNSGPPRPGGNTIGYPARYPNVFCVGSHNRSFDISNFSSAGKELDVATPGERVASTRAGGGFIFMDGTSMATPFFVGLMGLVLQKRREVGIPDIHGAPAWRQWFDQKGFFRDLSQPGKDPRAGLGAPLIENILNWLKDPEWT